MAEKTKQRIPATPAERIAEHKRQMLVQVWLPLAVGIVLVLAVCVLTVVGAVQGNGEISRWGSLSAVYVMIPTLLSSLITLALLVLIVRGMSSLLAKTPGWMISLQALFARIYAITRLAADKLAAPVLAAGGISEGLKAARRKIIR